MISSSTSEAATRPQLDRRPGSASGLEAAPRFLPWLLALLLAIVTFLAFSAALDAEFVNYDDDRLFSTNPMYRSFGKSELRWMFTTTFMGHYQPLTWLSSAVDHEISGMDPSSYHRNNLILHALNAVLFYLLAGALMAAARAGRSAPAGRAPAGATSPLAPGSWPLSLHLSAAVAALLFAIHPLRVESVAWASERRDVLSGFFLLLAGAAYLASVRPATARLASRRWYVISIVALALSLLSKSWGMSFFLIALLLDLYPLRRLPLPGGGRPAGEGVGRSRWWSPETRPVWRQKLPYLALGVAAAIVAGASQGGALQTMKSLAEWGVGARIAQAFYGLAFYAWKTLWPSGLVPLYELPARLDPFSARYLLSYAIVAAAVVVLVLLRRRLPALAAAAAAYAVFLAPVLGFAQSGPQLVADKYSYFSCMSFAVLGGAACLHLWERGLSRRGAMTCLAVGGVALLVLALLFASTARQTRIWQNSTALWSHALAAGEPTMGAHLNYGLLLEKEGRHAEALEHLEQAVTIRPQEGDAWYHLGNLYRQAKRWPEAEEAYQRACETMPLKHLAYMNLGATLHAQGRIEEAVVSLRAAVDHVAPLFGSTAYTTRPYLLLGAALADLGQTAEARRWLEVAARFPETRDAAMSRLSALPQEGRTAPPPPRGLDPSDPAR